MFEDVPMRLTYSVHKLQANEKFKDYIDHIAAAMVIMYYMGDDYISHKGNPPFVTRSAIDDKFDFHMTVWTKIIAEALFSLRNSPSFEAILHRLRSKDGNSAVFEMLEAYFYHKAEFEVRVSNTVKGLGQDFDFLAVRDNLEIAVEVTSLTNTNYSKATLLNALNRKRKQLDASRPSIIHVVYPNEWQSQVDTKFALRYLANIFLRGTRKVNAVCFLTKVLWPEPDGDGGGIFLEADVVTNATPRHRIDDMQFLFGGLRVSSGLKTALEKRLSLDNYRDELENSEYWKWYNYALSEEVGKWVVTEPVNPNDETVGQN